MSYQIYVVDAFTDTVFKGNPAAVCLTSEPLDDEFMQRIAMEMNLSETAFLSPHKDGYSKTELYAYQASKRGGSLKMVLQNGRVIMAGQAITVMKCELLS